MLKIKKIALVLLLIIFISIIIIGKSETYEELQLFNQALHLIRSMYVTKVDDQKIFRGAIKGMLRELDPYSQFMNPNEYKEMLISTKGSYGGVGIVISIKDEYLIAVSTIENTPSYKAGIQSGDKIIKINGEITKSITLEEAVTKLRGEPGTKVTISIYREGESDLIDYTLIREIIKPFKVTSKILEENIGYVRIVEFAKDTSQELEESLKNLEKNNLKGLVLDLRGNPGGLLDSAVEVTKKFIGDKKLIVYTEGRIKQQNGRYLADEKAIYKKHLVVLVNKGSASGAEIVAGAIQDWDRGIILGTQTFGKASVQTVLPLMNGCAMRLTTAHYFTPKGKLIHEKGITPDIVIENPKIKKPKDVKKEAKTKEIKEENKELIKKVKKQEEIADLQLQQAILSIKNFEILKKKFEILEN